MNDIPKARKVKLPPNFVLNLSFYNFDHAVTACFFTDNDFTVRKTNKAFQSCFFGKTNNKTANRNLLTVFEDVGMSQITINDFKNQLSTQGWANIPQIEIDTQNNTKYYSLFAATTEFKGIPFLTGVQGELIDRTHEVLLEKNQTRLTEQISQKMRNRLSANLKKSENLLQELPKLETSLLQSEVDAELIGIFRRTLSVIKENSDYLNTWITQMPDITKLQSRKLPLKLSRFRIRTMLQETIDYLKPIQTKLGVEVKIEGDSMEIEADSTQIRRVIEYYHSNALKNAKKKVVWRIVSNNIDLFMTVQDDGDGIPTQYLDRLFDPFFQLPGTKEEEDQEFGLDVIRALVELHKGQAWAESDGPNKGSRFCLKIPISQNLNFINIR